MSKRYDGKVAVVTGAANGIGKAIALRLVAEGAQVVFADIDGDAAAAAKPVSSSWLSVQPATSSFKVCTSPAALLRAGLGDYFHQHLIHYDCVQLGGS